MRKIRVVLGPAACRALWLRGRTLSTAVCQIAEVINGAFEAVDREIIRIAVNQRAGRVDQLRAQRRARCFELLLRRDRHAWS